MQQGVLRQFRTAQIERLTATELDVLVVGGGIVGAGIARDAAMRGLKVGLVEQHDLAFGTSSRSSRLLHGGLRYLAQGRLGLVHEASREKWVLRRIAPHLAEPLPFVFPTYRGTCWPLWQLRVGVKLYDLLCGGRNLGPSRSMSRGELLEHLPGVNPQNLTGGVRYFDGLTNDSRLVLDTLCSAARHGAVVCSYTRLENASRCGNQWECEFADVVSGRSYRLRARSVVNATGPWADQLPHSRIRLRLTKGVHLVIDRQRLPVPDAVVMADDRRILFAIPWGQRVILGTTDTDYHGLIEAVRTEPADVKYILEVVNAAFPAAALSEADVISTWAGLRPLIASKRGGPSDISRAHQIRMSEPGWLDVAGGKLTTYRRIAQQAVDRLLRYLRRRALPCRTADEPLLPAGETPGASGILPPPVTAQVVEHCCRHQWAVHLEDVMLRRTGWHYYLTDADQVASQVAGWMAAIFGWDRSEQEAELARYRAVAG
jgi:glycerol-3-phosphate dehydrogenase